MLFFARGLLSIDHDQLKAAMRDLFADVLTDSQMERLHKEMTRLIASEKEAEDTVRHSEMAQLIKGDPESFVTLWQSDGRP